MIYMPLIYIFEINNLFYNKIGLQKGLFYWREIHEETILKLEIYNSAKSARIFTFFIKMDYIT